MQLVKEKYKDWDENHAATEIKFKSRQLTAGGQGRRQKFRRCEPSISLEVAPAGKDESKDWDIYATNFLEVKEHIPPVVI